MRHGAEPRAPLLAAAALAAALAISPAASGAPRKHPSHYTPPHQSLPERARRLGDIDASRGEPSPPVISVPATSAPSLTTPLDPEASALAQTFRDTVARAEAKDADVTPVCMMMRKHAEPLSDDPSPDVRKLSSDIQVFCVDALPLLLAGKELDRAVAERVEARKLDDPDRVPPYWEHLRAACTAAKGVLAEAGASGATPSEGVASYARKLQGNVDLECVPSSFTRPERAPVPPSYGPWATLVLVVGAGVGALALQRRAQHRSRGKAVGV